MFAPLPAILRDYSEHQLADWKRGKVKDAAAASLNHKKVCEMIARAAAQWREMGSLGSSRCVLDADLTQLFGTGRFALVPRAPEPELLD